MMNKILGRSAHTCEQMAMRHMATASQDTVRIWHFESPIATVRVMPFLIRNPKSPIHNSKLPLEGVEPPPTYVDMDLNHARLPIPPQRPVMNCTSCQTNSEAASCDKLWNWL